MVLRGAFSRAERSGLVRISQTRTMPVPDNQQGGYGTSNQGPR